MLGQITEHCCKKHIPLSNVLISSACRPRGQKIIYCHVTTNTIKVLLGEGFGKFKVSNFRYRYLAIAVIWPTFVTLFSFICNKRYRVHLEFFFSRCCYLCIFIFIFASQINQYRNALEILDRSFCHNFLTPILEYFGISYDSSLFDSKHMIVIF